MSNTKEGLRLGGGRALSSDGQQDLFTVWFWLPLHAISHNHVFSHLSVPSLVAQVIPATQGLEWSNAPL